MTNPFSLSFGREPLSFIERGRQSREIIDSFSEENPACQVYMITGVRGAGKTVMLTDIAKYFRKENDWIVVDLSPERDLLQMLGDRAVVDGVCAAADADRNCYLYFRMRRLICLSLDWGWRLMVCRRLLM